jgi:predicted amidohydrolase
MRIALGQINTTVGDLAGNTDRIIRAAREASGQGADIAVFPGLAINGYPPRDLVEKPSFLEQTEEQLARLAAETAALPSAIKGSTSPQSGPEQTGMLWLVGDEPSA